MSRSDWIVKFLKNRKQVMVRFLEIEIYRRCLQCLRDTKHRKAEDSDGNHHHFCQECGSHN